MAISKIHAWIAAARPKTLAASVGPVLVACALAYRNGAFQWIPALLCLFVALFAQIASNLANDYFDFKKGADGKERLGQARAVASGWIEPEAMLKATFIVLFLACACGCGLLFYGSGWLILVGIAIALCVPAYSAGPYPLAYNGWGDVCVLLFYGIIPLCFTYYVQAGAFTWTAFWLSLSMGFLSVNILIVNNYRDYEQDAAVGKRTTIVLFGRKFGRILYLINAILAVVFAFPVYLYRDKGIWFLFLFFLMLQLFTWQDLRRISGSGLNQTLEQTSRNVLLFALLLVSLLAF
ncbi:MAG: 1,4-dihydroxy-2-naphthoate octaprenyltransferase [Tannerella sp.]|jgi:1,4-dihydroxy-2-naphthoate octaprenyltransferase|nr:1,4-dihydroxy-2-naphthoate octaprenyltransferase [Tannerella sp.]